MVSGSPSGMPPRQRTPSISRIKALMWVSFIDLIINVVISKEAGIALGFF
jgi:hypothetical protein